MPGKKREKAHCKPVYNVQKVVRLTRKGYFLGDYKRPSCGMSAQDIHAARQWNKLSPALKERFKNMMKPVIDTNSPPQEVESHSNGKSPLKTKLEKLRQKKEMFAYINFLRVFKKKNPTLEAEDLLKKSTRMWRRLQGHQRKKFEKPL
nr:protamine-like protein 99C [Drosophila takahashii]